MKRICTTPLLASIVVAFAVAIKDGSSQMHFMPQSDHVENRRSFTQVVEQGMSTILKMLTEEQPTLMHTGEHAASVAPAQEHASQPHRPSSRKMEYFRPVSITLQCVMTLTIVSMLVYTFLSMSRNYDELSATFTPSVPTQMLTIGARVSAFAPMLCMLFVACRMYILATTEGLGEPPAWVKSCMWVAVGGVLLQLVVVFALPMFSKRWAKDEAKYDMTEGKKKTWEFEKNKIDDTLPPTEDQVREDVEGGAVQPVQDATGEQNDVHPDLSTLELMKDSTVMLAPFWIVQILSMLCIYGGVAGVVTGIVTFPAESTKVSPAVLCTIALSILYFAVCFLLWAARATSDVDSPFVALALSMSTTIRKAPMFAVLFLASRMRALQLDPPYGMPPAWMQGCFYGITALVYLEAFMGAYVGATGEKIKGYYGVYIYRCSNKMAHLVHHGFAILSTALLIPVVIGVYAMPDHLGHAAPLSTTLKCVVHFQFIYFGVMLIQELVLFAEEYSEIDLTMLRDTVISAGLSLGLAPMLSILFVATRMRALQITQQMGAPPGWAQDCMLIAVFAICVQAVCCLLMPIFIGSACKVDDDGNPDYDLEPMVGAYAVAVVKYVALIALHGSVITICVAVFVMTPESAHDGGRFLTSTKNLFEALAATLGVFCIALLFSSAKVVGMAIKMAIEAADQELLGVDITVQKVALNLFKGYVHISKLKVHQPEFEVVYTKGEDGKLTKIIHDGQKDPYDANKYAAGHAAEIKLEWHEDYIAKIGLILVKINVGRILSTLGKEFELENLSLTGVHANIEKPDTDVKVKNSNIEYVIQHMDCLGLIPQVEAAPEKVEQDVEVEKVEQHVDAAEKVEQETQEAPDDIPLIIIHKIALGDIGAGVCIRKIPILGEISFHPAIPKIEFEDVQRDIFGGREDLKPPEIVACIFQALAKHIFNHVVHEIPSQIKEAAKGAASAMLEGARSSADGALRKLPCYDEPKSS